MMLKVRLVTVSNNGFHSCRERKEMLVSSSPGPTVSSLLLISPHPCSCSVQSINSNACRWRARSAPTTAQHLPLWVKGWPRPCKVFTWRTRMAFSSRRWPKYSLSSFFILTFSRWRDLAVREALRLLGERACQRRRHNRRTPSSSLQVFLFPAKNSPWSRFSRARLPQARTTKRAGL